MSTPELLKLGTAQLCLDYVNTQGYRHSPHPEEHLLDYNSLLEWSENAALLEEGEAENLRLVADSHPQVAQQAFTQAIEVRESLYRILAAHARTSTATDADLQAFNRRLGEVMAHARLSVGMQGYHWDWSESPRLGRPWWPAVHSAAELLTSPHLLERLGQCADPQCGWLFLDTSKSRTRKWCDINDCGNRAKQRRYQRRKRGE